MYVLQHAVLNLWKNKGRNILLGAIILAIITATVVALAIYSTTGVIIEETRAALQSAVRVLPQQQITGGNRQVIGGSEREAMVSLEQYLYFAESEYLDGADVREGNRNADGVDAVYYLKQPDLITSFEMELRSKGLPDDYAVMTDDLAFDSVAGSVDSLNSLSFTFLIIVIVLGAVIMMLLSSIAIRERKYEIGVLRAMGMKKRKVALGLWIEIIIITCICFALGLGVGTMLSQPVSDAILAGQTQSTVSGSTTLADRLADTETIEPEKVDILVSGFTAFQVLAVSLMLASITGLMSVSSITKSEPIKILMERN